MLSAFVTQSPLTAAPWAVAYQAPLSLECFRQEYWNGLPFPSPGDLPDSRTEPGSPAFQADSLLPQPLGKHNLIIQIAKLHMQLNSESLCVSHGKKQGIYWNGYRRQHLINCFCSPLHVFFFYINFLFIKKIFLFLIYL